MEEARIHSHPQAEGSPAGVTGVPVGLVLRSLVVHVSVWIMVGILGPIAIVLSPFTGGQIVFWLGWLWSTIILALAGVTLQVRGIERVPRDKAFVLVGNHTSNFDIYVMILALKNHYYRFLPKRELIYLPVFGWALWAGRFPFIDRSHSEKAHRTMNKLAARMKRTGMSILAFPEGTRNATDSLMLPFKKGPFIVAMEVRVPVLPFVIHGARRAQSRHSYLVHPGTIQVEFLDPIPTEGLTYTDRDAIVNKARSLIQEALLRGPREDQT